MEYNGAECPTDKTKPATFSIEIGCDKNIKDSALAWTLDSTDPCNAKVSTKTQSGCYIFSFNAIWAFLQKYSYVWGAFFIFFGLVMTFVGRKLFRPAICLTGTVATTFILLFFTYEVILNNHPPEWEGWTTLAVSILIGLLVGWFLAKVVKLGVALLAAWGGVSLGFICYSAFLYKIHSQPVFWVTIVGFGIVFAGLTFCIFDPVLILSTAFAGGYLIVRGISMYAGGYPNEFTLYDYIAKKQYSEIPYTFYIYMAGFIIFAILGSVVQFKHYKKDKEADTHPYRRYKH